MRVALREFQNLDLWAHSFLQDVPLHDAFVIYLPGGGEGRTIGDVRDVLPPESALKANFIVAALFKFRFFLGKIAGWDDPDQFASQSYVHRLNAEDIAESLIVPGTPDGPFRVLHMLPKESVSEVQNATVHAFLCQALQEAEGGYLYYWGVYVRPVSRLTPLYMSIIKPFRHLLVYPAILRRIRESWIRKYGGVAS